MDETTDISAAGSPKDEFMQLFLPVRHRLLRYARAIERSRDDADDLVCDTLAIAFERFATLREREAFLAFLLTIAARLHRKRARRQKFLGRYEDSLAHALPDRGPAPDSTTDASLLHDALQRLPARQRETVALFELADMTLEEVRSVQGGTLSGVKSRLRRGRERLAAMLTESPPQPDRLHGSRTAASDPVLRESAEDVTADDVNHIAVQRRHE